MSDEPPPPDEHSKPAPADKPATATAYAPRTGLPLGIWAGGLSLIVLALLAWLLHG